MGIIIPPDIEERIEALTRSKGYGSAAELLGEALDLLEVSSVIDDEALRSAVEEGIRDADAGDLVDGDVVFADLRRKIRAVAEGKPWERSD